MVEAVAVENGMIGQRESVVYSSTYNEARPKKRSDRGRFYAFRKKKTPHTGVRTGCHYLISLSVCVCVHVYDIRRFY